MPDLIDRLAALHSDAAAPADDTVVAADLRRAHAAAISRRRRRVAVAGAAAVGVLAAGTATWAASSAGTTQRHAVSAQSNPTQRRPAGSGALELVAYHGRQLPGYTVQQVPSGYVLQGISGSVLDVAEAGDSTALSTFSRKLVVMINDHPAPQDGTPVTVGGEAGRLVTSSDGVRQLYFADGKYNVQIQVWGNIRITDDQLIRFAEGVTVLPDVQVSHG